MSHEEWLNQQRHFNNSTAINSILGYVVGLGDRHLDNILLDKITGEVYSLDTLP